MNNQQLLEAKKVATKMIERGMDLESTLISIYLEGKIAGMKEARKEFEGMSKILNNLEETRPLTAKENAEL